jgi:hypothetical protein
MWLLYRINRRIQREQPIEIMIKDAQFLHSKYLEMII